MPSRRDPDPSNADSLRPEQGARLVLLGALLLTVAVAVLPGDYGSQFGGPPLTQAGRWWLTGGLWLLAFVGLVPPRRRLPALAIVALAALVAAKLWLSTGSTARGWQGTYEMLDEPPKQATFAWRFGRHPYRIDRSIAFDGRDFGLHFLNDNTRYGHKINPQTRDVLLPLRMSWRGFALLETPTPVSVFVAARGAVRVLLNGSPLVIREGPRVGEFRTTPGPMPAGWLDVQVVYDKPADVPPAIAVRLSSPATGDLDVRPFAEDAPARWPARLLPDASSALVMIASGFLAGLFVWAYDLRASRLRSLPPGDTVAKVAVLGVFAACLYSVGRQSIPWGHLTFHQWSGDDPLVYVSDARSVLLEGWLMPNGFSPGRGQPFYHYPLFAYVVGVLQAVIGEDYAAVQILNGWFVAAVVPLCWWLGWRSRSWWAATAGTLAMGWLLWKHILPYAIYGYTDSLFICLVFATLILCLRSLTGPWWYGPVAGVACAMAAGTRPSFLTFTPLFLVALLFAWRGVPRGFRIRTAAGVLAGFLAGLAPFAARNYIMSGKFAVLVTSWIQLPLWLFPPEVQPNPVLSMFSTNPTLGESLVAAARIFAADPVGVAGLELRKVAFTFGMTHWGMPGGSEFYPEFFVLSALFALVLLLRRLPAELFLVLVVFAVSHVVAMIMAVPWTYGYKTILPLHAVFLFSAVYLLPGGPGSGKAGP